VKIVKRSGAILHVNCLHHCHW